ncbi:MAG TPA: Uma2 family endonuclease [Candidatus Cybelea sp.]|jgi:Uma2 family endonuclease|nr:Uma2 family endonuclease [Candidatus Cybelea sp.]
MRGMATMQIAPELGIPAVKPAIELVRGRWEQKISPQRRHAIVQARLSAALTRWAGDRGEVGSEWRCYLLAPGEKTSSLVPDVAYFSFERMPLEFGELRERPTIAPDIAVEILSPGDRRALLDDKVAIYRASGCRLVLIVDPSARSAEVHEAAAFTKFAAPAVAMCRTYEDLRIDLTELFARL